MIMNYRTHVDCMGMAYQSHVAALTEGLHDQDLSKLCSRLTRGIT